MAAPETSFDAEAVAPEHVLGLQRMEEESDPEYADRLQAAHKSAQKMFHEITFTAPGLGHEFDTSRDQAVMSFCEAKLDVISPGWKEERA